MQERPTFTAEAFHGTVEAFEQLDPTQTRSGLLCFALDRDVAIGYGVDSAREGETVSLYTVALDLKDVAVVSCRGAHWSEVPCPWGGERRSIDEVAHVVIQSGYDAVVFRNVLDSVDTSDERRCSTVFVRRPDQFKVLKVERGIARKSGLKLAAS